MVLLTLLIDGQGLAAYEKKKKLSTTSELAVG
jgi:hypothetical protein